MGERHYNWMNDLISPVETRKSTNRLLEMIENGSVDPTDVVMMCLKFMSEDDVDEMCRINEIFEDDEEEDEDVED